MEIAFLIGCIVVGGYCIFSGIIHFQRRQMKVQYARPQGVPAADLAVPFTGLMLLVGGLSILLEVYPVIGVALLVLFLVPVAFQMHRFWGVDQQTAAMQMPHFMKHLTLSGSALMFLAVPTPWPLSVGLETVCECPALLVG